jgi:hypothetical protein
MATYHENVRKHLQTFEFRELFRESNWSVLNTQPKPIPGTEWQQAPIAEMSGVRIYEVTPTKAGGALPDAKTRAALHKHIETVQARENLIIFTDAAQPTKRTQGLWYWVKRDERKSVPRSHLYLKGQPGDLFLTRLDGLFISMDEMRDDGTIPLAQTMQKLSSSMDVERVTRRFYDQFKTEHTAFLKFLQGIDDTDMRDWYASVMLNRLMFLYFIQKKGFLNGDMNYLRGRLATTQADQRNYYHDFLKVLFFQGLATEEHEREPAARRLLGKIPYLNGGLFLPHSIEEQYGDDIEIANEAFERLFAFFDGYTWHLDDRPGAQDNEINPDVLGYIFEKYINQKQMGAYYTKEDITGYICRSTILPFLMDKCRLTVADLMTEVEPYIYDAVATEAYLPTETEREYRARRARFEGIRKDFAAGKISTVDDLITYNLDIEKLGEDWLLGLNDPLKLREFYFQCLTKLTVLDPTCGSGAFLFAAINILEPLYTLALKRMRYFVEKDAANRTKYKDFVLELAQVAQHPNEMYFVLKRIIVDNLYGVDIMEEAVEICKLRLFLKMVAQVDDAAKIEPLPDIDFNIRAGNTLVGFATKQEIEGRLFATPELKRKVAEVDREMGSFRDLQTKLGIEAKVFKHDKEAIQSKLDVIRFELDKSLMEDYGQSDLAVFRKTHQPFHWYVEFNSVLANGGFDVIVGNPPYVEYSKVRKQYQVRGYTTENIGNLYAAVIERSYVIAYQNRGIVGLIVPLSLCGGERFVWLRELIDKKSAKTWISNYEIFPSKLFEGAFQRLSILLGMVAKVQKTYKYVTKIRRWYSIERDKLLELTEYTPENSHIVKGVYPKLASSIQEKILKQLFHQSHLSVGYYSTNKKTGFFVFYQEATNYWMKATCRTPYYRKNGLITTSAHARTLHLETQTLAQSIMALMNSSLFYIWFATFSDGFHLSDSVVRTFPTDAVLLENRNLISLAAQLEKDIQRNSVVTTRNTKTDDIEVESFKMSASKPIIDEIDRVLARHYGFTDEELDFIIHYDIKYRMGRDGESESGEEE